MVTIGEIKCDICGYLPKSGTLQGLTVHKTRLHGIQSTEPRTVRDREAKRRRRAALGLPEPPPPSTNGNGSASTGGHMRRLRAARSDLVLMVQMLYPNGISTKDAHEVESFLAWCDETSEVLLKNRGITR